MSLVMDMPRPSMADKIEELRTLLEQVGAYTCAGLAARWNVTPQAVADMFSKEGAPKPLPIPGRANYYALPEAEAFRSQRLLRNGS